MSAQMIATLKTTRQHLHSVVTLLVCVGVGCQILLALIIQPPYSVAIALSGVAHMLMFGSALLLVHREALRIARRITLVSYLTYLTSVCILWQSNYHTHWFMLLGVFIACYLYAGDTTKRLIVPVSAYVAAFVVFELLYTGWVPASLYSMLLSAWPPIHSHVKPFVSFSNALLLLITCTSVAFSVRHLITLRWKQLNALHQQSYGVLRQILPANIHLNDTRSTPETIQCPQAVVMFIDMSGYSTFAAKHSPVQSMQLLHDCFCAFDDEIVQAGAERIKTNGDQYIAAIGLNTKGSTGAPGPSVQANAIALCRAALSIVDAFGQIAHNSGFDSSLRIGIACGSVSAGVIGKLRPHWDIWGVSVIRAARLEQTCPHNQVHICANTAALITLEIAVKNHGKIPLKGLPLTTSYLIRRHIADTQ
ncbi:adenylate/guanylate cyclase domain-containing protein [Alteromonas oceanisediminis]|uniref:adenylate/guanylate cyclase domain-containing protein n=1 Tax=Alteromonas oceanisediminis TaxID=2836180 RepID=UPI001BDB30C3|nr:adenylate/guanylate cyclase domain-containing protein [Alteromonas oceanisediminis]MBT0586584.1 adenylate/guanylate cyclase domain-containing protein [Alteromonas oceanisediminis]